MSKYDFLEELSFDAVLPSAILLNENIEPNAIKLYAFVRGLTKGSGYCYASNEYLSKCMKCDESTVKRLLKSLKMEGFLEIHTNKEGIHWQRHIYIGDGFKKCLRRLKNKTPPAQNQAPPSSKMSHNRRYSIGDIEKKYIINPNPASQESSPSAPPSASASGLSTFFLSKIKERYPEFKEPQKEKWDMEMDKLLRIDKRGLEKTQELIKWASTHKWWKTACLSPSKLRKDYDAMAMQMNADHEKTLIQKNRSWALELKNKHPEQMRNLSFDEKYARNLSASKEIPFTLEHEMFKETLVHMFGGTYVRSGRQLEE